MLSRDDVIRMAAEAGISDHFLELMGDGIDRFAAAAYAAGQAAEREALANMCDQASLGSKKSQAALMSDGNFGAACVTAGASEQAAKLADAIRARGEKGGV